MNEKENPNQELNNSQEEMNQEVNRVEEMNTSKLTEEEIRQLTEKAMEQGTEESKYFLKLELLTNYCHPEGYYRERYIVLFGEVKEIEISKIEDTCKKDEEIVVMPESKQVILLKYNGFENPEIIYVFNFKNGWRSLYL